MKAKIYILFAVGTMFLCLCVPSIQAEGPVITNTSIPSIGTAVHQQPIRSMGFIVGPAGAAKVWDYSSANDSGAVDVTTYLDAKSTPHSSLFPNANIAVRDGFDATNYSYFAVNSEVVEAFGSASQTDTNKMSNTQIVAWFPASFTSMHKDVFQGRMSGQQKISYTGTDSSYVDGYGTLKLPHGQSYSDVIRVSSVTTYEMTEEGEGGATYSYSRLSYSHFSASTSRGSLLDVSGMYIPGFGSIITRVQYASSPATDVSETSNSPLLSVAPNPALDLMLVRGEGETDMIGSVEVFNQLGERVMMFNGQGQSLLQLNLASLPTGVVYLRIEMNGKFYQRTAVLGH